MTIKMEPIGLADRDIKPSMRGCAKRGDVVEPAWPGEWTADSR